VGVSSRTTYGRVRVPGYSTHGPGALPGCFKDKARGYLFCSGCEECSDGRDHFREIVWDIKKNQDGSRKYNLV